MWIFTLRQREETSAHHTEHSLSVNQAEAPLYAMEFKKKHRWEMRPCLNAPLMYTFTSSYSHQWYNAMTWFHMRQCDEYRPLSTHYQPHLIYCNPTLYRTSNIHQFIINVSSKLHGSLVITVLTQQINTTGVNYFLLAVHVFCLPCLHSAWW